jgi:4-carboxymuconolactone decarboxylase
VEGLFRAGWSGLDPAGRFWETGGMKTDESRHRDGDALLQRITGRPGGEVMENLEAFCPDLAGFIRGFCYGEVLSRPGLDLKSRQLITVAALTAMQVRPEYLKIHIGGALNTGATPREIIEVILQMAVYAGFPAAMNGIHALQEVFRERGIEPPR